MPERSSDVTLGLLGAGNVGNRVYQLSQETDQSSINISKVFVRDKTKKRNFPVPQKKLTTDPTEITEDEKINLIISVVGEEVPEKKYILDSLKNKKSVVTASKLVMAKYGREIFQTAEDNEVGVYFEAAVAGGIQIVDNLQERYSVNRITELTGIVNGTTNYILTKMANEGMSFKKALKEAQEKGYAEPDPTDDVQGYDARYKLALLSTLAFREGWIDYSDISCEGITGIDQMDFTFAKELNYRIKLIAQAKRQNGAITAWVAPTFLYRTHPLAQIDNATNAILLRGDPVGDIKLEGPGAGNGPTTASVWSDVKKAEKQIRGGFAQEYPNYANNAELLSFDNTLNRHYIRARISNAPMSLAKFATIMGEQQVSIDEILQPKFAKYENNTVVEMAVITEPSREADVAKSLKILDEEEVVKIGAVFRVLD